MGTILIVLMCFLIIASFIPSKPFHRDPEKHFEEHFNHLVGNDQHDDEYETRLRNEAHQEWINTKRQEKMAVWRMYTVSILSIITFGLISFGKDDES